jgi:uncharacterized membrane-anchored protein YjiN (DUF445 family)
METMTNETMQTIVQDAVTVLGETIKNDNCRDITLMNIIQLLAEKEEIFLSNFLLQYKQDNEKEIDGLHDELVEKDKYIEELEDKIQEVEDYSDEIHGLVDDLYNAADNLKSCFRN